MHHACAINTRKEAESLTQNARHPTNILVITPHPDDAEGGAGGTIAKWAARGSWIGLVVCTNGDKGTSDRDISPEDLARTREEEQLNAAKVLGIQMGAPAFKNRHIFKKYNVSIFSTKKTGR